MSTVSLIGPLLCALSLGIVVYRSRRAPRAWDRVYPWFATFLLGATLLAVEHIPSGWIQIVTVAVLTGAMLAVLALEFKAWRSA
jgi:hypothetical protein